MEALLSTHNIGFHAEVRKISGWIEKILLSTHCLLFSSRFLTDIFNKGGVQIQRRKTPLQKVRDERVKLSVCLKL